MKEPYLLFDFDGTIANSIDILYEIINLMAPEYGMDEISREDFNVLRNMSLPAIMRFIKIPWYRLPGLVSKALKEYKKRIRDLHPYEGIEEMLISLRHHKVGMALLSSNSTANVMRFLDRHRLHYFDWVEGTSGALNKRSRINHQIKKHRLDTSKVIYVGDESRDIVAAQECDLRVISVTWGFHSERLLQRFKPDYIVDSPAEIESLVLGLREV